MVYDAASRRRLTREFSFIGGVWALQSEQRLLYDGTEVVQERDATNDFFDAIPSSPSLSGTVVASQRSHLSIELKKKSSHADAP